MRLIDADALIKTVDELPHSYNGWSDAYDKSFIIQTIEDAPTIEPCEDAISREALIKKFWKVLYDYEDETEKQFIEHEELDVGDWIDHRYFVQTIHGLLLNEVVDAPSVAPSRPSGEWKEVYAETDYRNGWIEFSCECCGHQHGLESGEYGWSYGEPIPWKFCPLCGAKMKGE